MSNICSNDLFLTWMFFLSCIAFNCPRSNGRPHYVFLHSVLFSVICDSLVRFISVQPVTFNHIISGLALFQVYCWDDVLWTISFFKHSCFITQSLFTCSNLPLLMKISVTGSGSVGKCARLGQPSWLLVRTII